MRSKISSMMVLVALVLSIGIMPLGAGKGDYTSDLVVQVVQGTEVFIDGYSHGSIRDSIGIGELIMRDMASLGSAIEDAFDKWIY